MYRDHQLMGGFLNEQNAFSRIDDKILFQSGLAVGRTDMGGGETDAINLNAHQSPGAVAVFHEGNELLAGVKSATRLVDMRYGEGINPVPIRISGGGDWYDLDLSAATTMGDLVTLISGTDIDGRTLAASLTNDGIRVEYLIASVAHRQSRTPRDQRWRIN